MANQVYTVKSGDTLGSISTRFGGSPQSIANASNRINMNNIQVAQKLFIPLDTHEGIASIISNQSLDTAKPINVNKEGFVTDLNITKDRATNLEHGTLKEVNAIVLHRTATSGYSKPKGTTGAHFYISKDGEIHQTASLNKKTWHVGKIKSKCKANNTCSSQEAQKIKLFGWNPAKIYNHEKIKPYVDRYPTNHDSVGIEVVGGYDAKTKEWEAVTEKQKVSVNKLIDFLEKEYNLRKEDRYNHEDVSYKTAGEGATVEKIVVD